MNTIFYFIKEALRGFLQAKLMTIISMMTIGIALFFVGSLLIVYVNTHRILENISGQAGLVAYLDDSIDTSARVSLMERIEALPEVQKVLVIDKAEAWARFERAYGTQMLEAVNDNPFPASIEAYFAPAFRSLQGGESAKKQIEGMAGIVSVAYSHQWLSRLERIRRYVVWGTVGLILVTGIALNFMIANTVKLTIYARRELVVNMRYVGASDAYIQMPFLLEGMLQGVLGAAAAGMLLIMARLMLAQTHISWISPSVMLAVLLVVGVVFGWMGSRSAVRKFLA